MYIHMYACYGLMYVYFLEIANIILIRVYSQQTTSNINLFGFNISPKTQMYNNNVSLLFKLKYKQLLEI